MGVSKAMKRRTKRRVQHKVGIQSLPNDLLMEVLAKVASASFTDLFNAKVSCKDFYALAKDDYIFQHVSLEEFPLFWYRRNHQVLSFLRRCKESGNANALFREGIREYFTLKNQRLGLEFLEKASEKGLAEASYIYGLILICSGGQLKQQGLQLLSSVITGELGGLRIKECRKRVKNHIQCLWMNNSIVRDEEPYCHIEKCSNYGRTKNSLTAKRAGNIWLSGDYVEDEDVMCCAYCQCDHEVNLFCKRFMES